MSEDKLFLGLDTSNYTTSVAIVSDAGEILEDRRTPLSVKDGEKGLRQQEALYQHWNHLPLLLDPLLNRYASSLAGICVSEKPRPLKDSYMPVFNAGLSVSRIIAAALSIPLLLTTHQEGHFKAGLYGNNIDTHKPLIAAHLSGGTCELVTIIENSFTVVGGSKDISYGQLLDRTGALLDLSFPSGRALDELADAYGSLNFTNPLAPIFTEEAWMNLSGTETQIKKMLNQHTKQELSTFLFERVADSFIKITETAKRNILSTKFL